jgi:hypothetical protein
MITIFIFSELRTSTGLGQSVGELKHPIDQNLVEYWATDVQAAGKLTL